VVDLKESTARIGEAASRPMPKPARKSAEAAAAQEKESLWEWAKSLAIAFLLFVIIRTFLIQAYTIPSGSMEDTLLVGDYLMANNAVFGATIPFTSLKVPAFRDPHFRDVVVFRPAYNDPVIDVVKRVMAEPGDTIRMVDRVVYRNGDRLEEPYVEDAYLPDEPMRPYGFGGYEWHLEVLHESVDRQSYRPTRDNWGPLVVPEGHYVLLGDNRDQSLDSRYVGFIPREVIRGKAMFLYFSKVPDGGLGGIRWDRVGQVIR
jgi:signal peptidase I